MGGGSLFGQHGVRDLGFSQSFAHQCVRNDGGARIASHFRRLLVGRTVLLLSDNTTVAAYINRRGGTRSSSLDELAARLWQWCRAVEIMPVASVIPGQDNLVADFLSRGRCLASEWALHLEVFDLLLSVWSPLEIDLFASSFNNRLPKYCSRVYEPEAWWCEGLAWCPGWRLLVS